MKIKVSIIAIIIILIFCLYVSAAGEDEAITKDGGIAASWVLTGAFIVIGSLITFIIYDMKRQFSTAMKLVMSKLDGHEEELKEHTELHGRADEKFKTIFKKIEA